MRVFYQGLRYRLRGLVNQPALALIAVLSLALGIGANTAVFSVVRWTSTSLAHMADQL